METQENLYQKVNAVFEEREEILKKRETDIEMCRKELLKIQANLLEEKGAIEQKKKELEAEKAELLKERKSIENKQQELKEQQDSVSGILAEIIEEKLQLQSLKNARLRQENEQETTLLQQTKDALGMQEQEANLQQDALVEMISEKDDRAGMSAIDQLSLLGKSENLVVTDPKVEIMNEKTASNTDESKGDIVVEEEQDGLIQQFAKEVKEVFPDGNTLETTDELFCIAIADKELRIMLQNPPVAIILAKREKNKALLKGISQLNQAQTEWEFDYQDNCLRCRMPFTKSVPVEVILQKCADAMNRYFL